MNASLSHATAAGTRRYTRRFPHLASDHFRLRYGLHMSSIGLGTYLGAPTAETSERNVAAIREAVRRGCNVIDTAINYRYMRSERDVGRALGALFDAGEVGRDEVIVCTKGGFVPFDGAPPPDPAEYVQELMYALDLDPMEIVGNVHSMAPAYLRHQIARSLANLGLQTIDVYYLHNPETQLSYVTPGEFRKRLRAAFACLEQEAADGRIRFYGVATWDGLRISSQEPGYLSLSLLMETAREVGGPQHRFRFIQFPYNLDMLEAVTDDNQTFAGERDGQFVHLTLPLLAAARQYALVAVGSAGLLQGQLLGQISPELKVVLGHFDSDAQYAIHFNRSTPALTTTLVGTGRPEHVHENLAVAQVPMLEPSIFFDLFRE